MERRRAERHAVVQDQPGPRKHGRRQRAPMPRRGIGSVGVDSFLAQYRLIVMPVGSCGERLPRRPVEFTANLGAEAVVALPGSLRIPGFAEDARQSGEIVKAFVVLKSRVNAVDSLKAELQQHDRARLSLHAYPREIEFIEELPKTPSGKIQRFLLRQI